MGKKKANIALANLILRISYHMLKNHTMYEEVGNLYYKKKADIKEEKLIEQLKAKGYSIEKIVV